jgi:hypothetical protein
MPFRIRAAGQPTSATVLSPMLRSRQEKLESLFAPRSKHNGKTHKERQ